MQINDKWKIKDGVSGLKFEVKAGKNLDTLHVESLSGGRKGDDRPKMNRDFYFTKEGKFDGTGSWVGE